MDEAYPPVLVVDATVLINFARVERLELLDQLETEIWCPQEIWEQTVVKTWSDYDVESEMRTLYRDGTMKVKEVNNPEQLQLMATFLKRMDEGEADALALAVTNELPVVTDDRACRNVADEYDLNYTGTIGLLFSLVKKNAIALEQGAQIHEQMKEEAFYSPIQSATNFIEVYRQKRNKGEVPF